MVLRGLRRNGRFGAVIAEQGLDERRQWTAEISLCRRIFGRSEAQWLWRQSPLPVVRRHRRGGGQLEIRALVAHRL